MTTRLRRKLRNKNIPLNFIQSYALRLMVYGTGSPTNHRL
jgi:hypothetical protein